MKKIVSTFFVACICLLVGTTFTACNKGSKMEYDADDIAYVSNAGESISYLSGLGDYYKTNNGAAMAGLRVSTDDKWVGLVVVGKTEAAVTYHYDYNGTVYKYSEGTVEHNGETYYYAAGTMFGVSSPMTSYQHQTYCAYAEDAESFARKLLEIGDVSKLAIPTISTAEDLQKLSGSSHPFMLANDIDLGGVSWTLITGFKGTLDGAGYTIKNFTVSGSNGNFGLFDELNGATITNLTLEGVNVTAIGTSGDIGGLAGVVRDSTVKNVTVSGSVSAILMDNVGGIIGYAENSTIEGCKNYATVTGFKQVGGVTGQYGYRVASEDKAVENNENHGAVTGLCDTEDAYIGGVFGRVNFWPGAYKSGASNWLRTIINCNNYGKVVGAGNITGGVIGGYTTSRWASGDTYVDVAFANCKNEGEVIGGALDTGGIAGKVGSCRSVMNCENSGKISGTGYSVGGIIGSSGSISTVTMCKNSGEISGAAFVGGILGYTNSIITSCENSGSITATGQRNTCDFLGEDGVTGVGGIVGVTGRYVAKSTNNGNIYSTGGGSCIGGIAGGMVAKNGDIIEGNVNNGYMNVTGVSNMVGGVVGKMYSTRPGSGEGQYTFSAKNTANVTAGESFRVGGIIGYIATQSNWSYTDRTYALIINCENSGMITGAYRVAGIVGTIWNYARFDDIYWSTNKNIGTVVCDAEEKAELYLTAS